MMAQLYYQYQRSANYKFNRFAKSHYYM